MQEGEGSDTLDGESRDDRDNDTPTDYLLVSEGTRKVLVPNPGKPPLRATTGIRDNDGDRDSGFPFPVPRGD